jgi:hypothetical protein
MSALAIKFYIEDIEELLEAIDNDVELIEAGGSEREMITITNLRYILEEFIHHKIENTENQ